MIVPKTLREEMQKRFPGNDFLPYFDFIESLLTADRGEKHHILPQKEFPGFKRHPENLIKISYQDHFKAHYWLAICAPECGSFQNTVWFMANYKARHKIVSVADLPKFAEIYERGKNYQHRIVTEGWDGKRRAEQSETAKRVNKAENNRLKDFKCPKCGREFQQVKRSIYAGHRRFCLHYSDSPVPNRPFVVPSNEQTKRCGKCGVEKPLVEFNIERKARLGRANYCRSCARAHQANKNAPGANTLHDYACSNCGMEFKQVKPGVFGGHRKSCLNYGKRRKALLSWTGSVQDFAARHSLPIQTVIRWKDEIKTQPRRGPLWRRSVTESFPKATAP